MRYLIAVLLLVGGAQAAVNEWVLGEPTYVQDNAEWVLGGPFVELDNAAVPSCVLWYKCNDDAATTAIIDDSAGATDGALAGGDNTEDINIAGHINGGLQLNGSDDYFDCEQNLQATFSDSFTFAIWINADDGQVAGLDEFISFRDGDTDDGIEFGMGASGVPGNLWFLYQANSNKAELRTAVVLPNGPTGWHFIVGVADADLGGVGGLKLYYDNVLQDAVGDVGDTSGIMFSEWSVADDLFVGAKNNDGTPQQFFNGGIDNVMIYDFALNSDEINWLWNSGTGREDISIPVSFGFPQVIFIMSFVLSSGFAIPVLVILGLSAALTYVTRKAA